ncbi:DUF29 domain-containing protein [Sphingomonas sp.]|jgi:hypothetical protein|uniref:DUF29 domain-containing protein n=1 Tax=Sphingomonas sp. TaxID=28214 RepID=UPI002D7F20CB|nr:DUF29 domain-containing protein [Sphingomonas sp.]HEU0042998.1 DUF29 domain-containing protein [Sphingomonas sp.]
MATQLYEADFFEWTQRQAAVLRRMAAERANTELDLENLAEEIESVGGSDKKQVKSRLTTILEHMLKIAYSPAYEPLNGWRGTIRVQRRDLLATFEQSPSLRRVVRDEFERAYKEAAEDARLSHIDLSLAPIPTTCPFDLEAQVLNPDWLPEPLIRPPHEC